MMCKILYESKVHPSKLDKDIRGLTIGENWTKVKVYEGQLCSSDNKHTLDPKTSKSSWFFDFNFESPLIYCFSEN